jgi:hypothetical protein
MKTHIARGVAAMTLALVVGACSDTLNLDAAGDVAMQIQRMSPGLFGAPQGSPAAERSVSPDTVSSFKVTITAIQFLHSGDSESGTWTTMRLDAPVTIDLMGAPSAQQVHLAGDFSGWQPNVQLVKSNAGTWVATVPVAVGVHRYQFVVDDSWVPDPAVGGVDDGFGGRNSVMVVGPKGVVRS